MTMTFKQFLMNENSSPATDVEDMTPDEMDKKAMEMRRDAQRLRAGQGDAVKRQQIMRLQQMLRDPSISPQKKLDVQRRIKELTAPADPTV